MRRPGDFDELLPFRHLEEGLEALLHAHPRAFRTTYAASPALAFDLEPGCLAGEWVDWGAATSGHLARALRAEHFLLHEERRSAPKAPAQRQPAPAAPPRRSPPERDPVVAALEARVQKLEQIVKLLLAERAPAEEEVVPKSPHDLWIDAHAEELRAHPDSFIALDAEKGIVIHTQDGDDFEAQLEKLSPEVRDRVVLLHTSEFFR